MKKRRTGGEIPVSDEPGVKDISTVSGIAPSSFGLPWKLTFVVLAALLLILCWYPFVKIWSHYDGGTNEGFNSYFQQSVLNGDGLYRQPPVFFYANYPPISYHLIALIASFTHNVNPAGRWVSLAAYLAIGILIGLLVRRLTGQLRFAVYAAICWLVWLAAFDMSRIGFNDPHLLGIALNLLGFYLFVRDGESSRSLIVSGAVFAVSLFTKQTLIAFPAAVGIDLLFRSRRRLFIWAGALIGCCVLLLLLTFAIDGRYFFDHLMLPRTFSYADMGTNIVSYLTFVQIPLVAVVIWMLWRNNRASIRVFLWAFLIAHLFGGALTGGNGAGVNHLFDAMITVAILIGLVLADIESVAHAVSFPRAFLAVALIVPCFLSSLLALPHRVPYDIARNERGTPALEREFAAATAFVRAQPGPALCESLMLCFEAGKAETFDAFAVDQAIKTGHLSEQPVLQLLASRRFGAIEIDYVPGEPLRAAARHRFSAAFMAQLLANYRPAYRDSRYAVFVPSGV